MYTIFLNPGKEAEKKKKNRKDPNSLSPLYREGKQYKIKFPNSSKYHEEE